MMRTQWRRDSSARLSTSNLARSNTRSLRRIRFWRCCCCCTGCGCCCCCCWWGSVLGEEEEVGEGREEVDEDDESSSSSSTAGGSESSSCMIPASTRAPFARTSLLALDASKVAVCSVRKVRTLGSQWRTTAARAAVER